MFYERAGSVLAPKQPLNNNDINNDEDGDDDAHDHNFFRYCFTK